MAGSRRARTSSSLRAAPLARQPPPTRSSPYPRSSPSACSPQAVPVVASDCAADAGSETPSARTRYVGRVGVTLSTAEILQLQKQRLQDIKDFKIALRTPPPRPMDWPRANWKGTCFTPPVFYGSGAVDSDEIAWACKKATVALVRNGATDATTVYLAVLDKVLQLNLHSRDTHGATGCLAKMSDWAQERSADIEEYFRRALADYPSSEISLSHCKTVCMAALKLDYMEPLDAREYFRPEARASVTFDRLWIGPYSPVPADAAAHGLVMLKGSVSLKADLNKLLREALKWAATHPRPPRSNGPSPLHIMPPLNPPPRPPRSALPPGLEYYYC